MRLNSAQVKLKKTLAICSFTHLHSIETHITIVYNSIILLTYPCADGRLLKFH